MFSDRTLARPYAKALFEEAGPSEALRGLWYDVLTVLSDIVADPEFVLAYKDPAVSVEVLVNRVVVGVLENVLAERLLPIEARVKNFIHLLFEHKRILIVSHIRELFQELVLECRKVVVVEILVESALRPEQEARVVEYLEALLNVKVSVEFSVDSTVRGGFLIKAKEKVLDATLRGRLDRLYRSLRSA